MMSDAIDWQAVGQQAEANQQAADACAKCADLTARLASAEEQNNWLNKDVKYLRDEAHRWEKSFQEETLRTSALTRGVDTLKAEVERVMIINDGLRVERDDAEAAVEQARSALLHVSVTSSRYRSHQGTCQARCICDAIMDDKLIKAEIGRVVQPALAALTSAAGG